MNNPNIGYRSWAVGYTDSRAKGKVNLDKWSPEGHRLISVIYDFLWLGPTIRNQMDPVPGNYQGVWSRVNDARYLKEVIQRNGMAVTIMSRGPHWIQILRKSRKVFSRSRSGYIPELGLFMFTSPGDIRTSDIMSRAVVGAVGRCRVFGRVVDHERGMRATNAILDKLWIYTVSSTLRKHVTSKPKEVRILGRVYRFSREDVRGDMEVIRNDLEAHYQCEVAIVQPKETPWISEHQSV